MTEQINTNRKFYTTNELVGRNGVLKISRASLVVGVRNGQIPKPVKLGGKNVWPAPTIDEFCERVARGEGPGPIQPRKSHR